MWDLIVSVPDHCLSFYFKPSLVVLVKTEFMMESIKIRFQFVSIIRLSYPAAYCL